MEERLDCDFYFGDKTFSKIKKIDYDDFDKEVRELKFFNIKFFYWLLGASLLCFKPYKKYVLTGEAYSISYWSVLLLNKILGKKTYLWTHGLYGNEKGIKKIVKNVFYKLADGLFVYGEYSINLLKKINIPKDKLHYIGNSLDYDNQCSIRKELKTSLIYKNHFKNELPILFFIGRLGEGKKLEMLVEAQRLTQKTTPFNLVFIGDGIAKEKLEKLVDQYSLQDYVWFFGACYEEKVIAQLIYNADLCVSPGFVGLTAIHSMSFGTPVISHNSFYAQMPEFEAIQESVTGSFFEENDIEDLTEVIQNWLKKYPSKTEEVIENCFYKVDTKFNPYIQMEQFERILL